VNAWEKEQQLPRAFYIILNETEILCYARLR